jgi:outer membrane protein OmpA-like peptidoglycan-associated protein
MKVLSLKSLLLVTAILSLSLFIGCAGFKCAPDSHYLFYHKELPEAKQAVEKAQKAGKDWECFKEFKVAEDLKDRAYETYWKCMTREAIVMAKEATRKADALCPSSAPRASAKPAPAPSVLDRMTLKVNFDFNKSEIRKQDTAKLQKAIDFVKKYPGARVMLEGHTDSIGTKEYNQRLSEMRAESVKRYLVENSAVDGTMIRTVGYGESRPVDSNETEEGRSKNRRVEIIIMRE